MLPSCRFLLLAADVSCWQGRGTPARLMIDGIFEKSQMYGGVVGYLAGNLAGRIGASTCRLLRSTHTAPVQACELRAHSPGVSLTVQSVLCCTTTSTGAPLLLSTVVVSR